MSAVNKLIYLLALEFKKMSNCSMLILKKADTNINHYIIIILKEYFEVKFNA